MKSSLLAFSGRLGATSLIAFFLWSIPVMPGSAHDDQGQSPNREMVSTANLQAGVVNAVGSRDIRINGVDYPMDANVDVTDDEGRPREIKLLVPETDIKFQVKKGRVTQIVIVLPK
jgi:hypothetical protein